LFAARWCWTGATFFVDGTGRNTMRLTFAKESDERLVKVSSGWRAFSSDAKNEG